MNAATGSIVVRLEGLQQAGSSLVSLQCGAQLAEEVVVRKRV